MSAQCENFVGAVAYCPGDEGGTLEAEWIESASNVVCKGWATGGPAKGFVGDYSIVYYDERSEPSSSYDLRIDRSGEIFHLKWSQQGRQIYEGIGMLRDDTIVAGYCLIR